MGKKQSLEVADIFRLYGQNYRQSNALSYAKIKVMHHIEACRTAQLGGDTPRLIPSSSQHVFKVSFRERSRNEMAKEEDNAEHQRQQDHRRSGILAAERARCAENVLSVGHSGLISIIRITGCPFARAFSGARPSGSISPPAKTQAACHHAQ